MLDFLRPILAVAVSCLPFPGKTDISVHTGFRHVFSGCYFGLAGEKPEKLKRIFKQLAA